MAFGAKMVLLCLRDCFRTLQSIKKVNIRNVEICHKFKSNITKLRSVEKKMCKIT